MGISKEEAIKELQTREEIFVAYSQATKLPYVKCDLPRRIIPDYMELSMQLA